MKVLSKYSIGLGDRFGHQGGAQLRAIIEASRHGIEITPVWNKSNREHLIIGTQPQDVRTEADQVTKEAGFSKDYFVDADHINLDTVDRFIESSDFFTIDVASYIGKRADNEDINRFISGTGKYKNELRIPRITSPFRLSDQQITQIAEKYLHAAKKAGEIYRKIEKSKGTGNFITEVSMDEVPEPQSPVELFFILMMLAYENVPLQTIAPRFSGRFNKGVEYVGDPAEFASEFESDLMVIDHVIREFGLPENLKMSIHSGSDKFAIYPQIGSLIARHDKGIHVKTAGTTWLEEIIGLAASGGVSLEFAKAIYIEALDKIEELCAPYADVIDIRADRLPARAEVSMWDSSRFTSSLRHIPDNQYYNSDMRQLIHVAYKLAAHRIDTYYSLLEQSKAEVSAAVYENIYNRHICRLFGIK